MKSQRQKRIEAEQRAAAHAKRSVKEQLALIADRPGESKREKLKLEARLEASKPVQVTPAATTTVEALEGPMKKTRKPRAKKAA
jgi:hypothetical protein